MSELLRSVKPKDIDKTGVGQFFSVKIWSFGIRYCLFVTRLAVDCWQYY
ncbi:MAG: hypothetical protein AAF960_19835 [Bacteroidota bacterium]